MTGYLENEFHNQVSGLLWHEPNIGPQSFPIGNFKIPVVQNITINITDMLNLTNGTINSSWNFYDLDLDTQQDYQIKWYNDTSTIFSFWRFVEADF